MSSNKPWTLVAWACLVGFLGDALLQALVNNGVGDWGLSSYFAQHGRYESMFVAAGMLGVFYALYIALGLPIKVLWLAVYGVILDLVFRKTVLFPSLQGYYAHLGYIESAVWGAIPLVLPYLLRRLFVKS